MSTNATTAITTTTAEVTVAEGNKHMMAFEKALAAYGKALGTFKEKTVQTVVALRLEGYPDNVIRKALRAVVEKHGVTPQHLNRVLTAPTSEGGAGMENERKHAKSGSASVKGELAKDAAKGGVTVKLGDAASLFAALMAEFDGKATKVALLAERLNELAYEAIEKAKPSKAK